MRLFAVVSVGLLVAFGCSNEPALVVGADTSTTQTPADIGPSRPDAAALPDMLAGLRDVGTNMAPDLPRSFDVGLGDASAAADASDASGAADVADLAGTADVSIDASIAVDLGPPPNPLDGIGPVELIDESFQFTEGPRWFQNEGVLRFSDIPASTIYELQPPSTISVFRTPSGASNGLAVDAAGGLLAAEHDSRRISITVGGNPQTLVGQYQGMSFNSPNDLVVRSDGLIFFTDPPYGLGTRPREIPFNGLYRYVPATNTLSAEWMGNAASTRPNGVVLSPDESLIYMADTQLSWVCLFDVLPSGQLFGERVFVNVAAPDGMAIDTYGNLYVTTDGGVEVFAPDGTSWGKIDVARRPANVAFGGPDAKTLYITAREGLYRVSLTVAGIY